ncbi:MAG: hypothetical protein HY904_07085 [Deltaproteobacteria bacterium]|nr:hypothetical protein [Deltaproteobacteria bacterium]
MATSGARCSGVARWGAGLVFRAEGAGLAPGIHVEESGLTRAVLADSAAWRWVTPRVTAGVLTAGGLPRDRVGGHVEAVAFRVEGRDPVVVPGHAWAVRDDGKAAVVADARGAQVHRVWLQTGAVEPLCALAGEVDPLSPPWVGLDAAGVVLLAHAPTARGEVTLESVTLESGERRVLHGPVPGPAWVTAAAAGARVVVFEMRLGDAPVFRILAVDGGRPARTLAELPRAQPWGEPVLVDEQCLVAPLSLASHAEATHGPVELVALRLDGGTPVPLTREGSIRGTLRNQRGTLVLEGGRQLGEVLLTRP